jgi:hypothetical protein
MSLLRLRSVPQHALGSGILIGIQGHQMHRPPTRNLCVLAMLLILLVGGAHAMAQSETRLHELLTSVEMRMPESGRYPESFIENTGMLRSAEFTELQHIMKDHWAEFLDHLADLQLNHNQETIFVISARALPRAEYIQFLNRVADAILDERLPDGRLLEWSLFPREKHLAGFIGDDYQDPAVRRLLEIFKKMHADDRAIGKFADDALSGHFANRTLRQKLARFLEGYGLEEYVLVFAALGLGALALAFCLVLRGRRRAKPRPQP